MPYLHTPIEAISGVGAARKIAYNKMGIYTVEDLIATMPIRAVRRVWPPF